MDYDQCLPCKSPANEELIIREAVETDLTALLKLYAQLGMDDGRVLPLEIAEAIFERMHGYPCYRIYLAESAGQVVGTFALLMMDNLGHFGTPSAIVEDVVVAEEWRNLGIGQRMMVFAYRQAQLRGCYKLVLNSNGQREQAHRFYESIGFRRHGVSFMVDVDPWQAGAERE
jgi:GNAT superfamily N-acetyltransferase